MPAVPATVVAIVAKRSSEYSSFSWAGRFLTEMLYCDLPKKALAQLQIAREPCVITSFGGKVAGSVLGELRWISAPLSNAVSSRTHYLVGYRSLFWVVRPPLLTNSRRWAFLSLSFFFFFFLFSQLKSPGISGLKLCPDWLFSALSPGLIFGSSLIPSFSARFVSTRTSAIRCGRQKVSFVHAFREGSPSARKKSLAIRDFRGWPIHGSWFLALTTSSCFDPRWLLRLRVITLR